MKHIKLYENWIKLKDDYKGTQPRPGSRFQGGDEGEWKFIWKEENDRKNITSEIGLSVNGQQEVYEVYQPDAIFDLIGYDALKNGTELSKNLFSDYLTKPKHLHIPSYLSDDNVELGKYPTSGSNNSPSSPEWNRRLNYMIKTLIVKDVLVHIDYKSDIRFVSILKEEDYRRYDELGMNSNDKEATPYSIKKSKPFDRRGKERRFFDEKGKEVMPKNEPFDKKNPTIQGLINDFQINCKTI